MRDNIIPVKIRVATTSLTSKWWWYCSSSPSCSSWKVSPTTMSSMAPMMASNSLPPPPSQCSAMISSSSSSSFVTKKNHYCNNSWYENLIYLKYCGRQEWRSISTPNVSLIASCLLLTWFYRSLKTGEDAKRAHSGGGGGRQVRSQLVCPEQGEVQPATCFQSHYVPWRDMTEGLFDQSRDSFVYVIYFAVGSIRYLT